MPSDRRQQRPSRDAALLKAALDYADAGIPVIPLHGTNTNGQCTCGKKKCPAPGKHPRTTNWPKAATTDARQIKKWWKRWPDANIGGVGGKFVCLDVDPKKDGHDSLADLEAEHGKIATATVKTGKAGSRRGRHFWFVNENGASIATRAGVLPGIDVRGVNGYAVLLNWIPEAL